MQEWGKSFYFNWDNQKHRSLILEGVEALAREMELYSLREQPILVVFDEIYKYPKWKNFLKGF